MVKEYFLKYKNITEKMIKEIENNTDIMDLMDLMDERESLLKEICSSKDYKVIKDMYYKLELDCLDYNLKIKIECEQLKVKEELENLRKRMNATKRYSNVIRPNNIFSEKI